MLEKKIEVEHEENVRLKRQQILAETQPLAGLKEIDEEENMD